MALAIGRWGLVSNASRLFMLSWVCLKGLQFQVFQGVGCFRGFVAQSLGVGAPRFVVRSCV